MGPSLSLAFMVLALAILLSGAARASERGIQELTSPRGIKLWLMEERGVPIVAIRFAFVGGTVHEPPGKEGITDFLLDMLDEGSGDLGGAAFKERLERTGSRLSFGTARDAVFGGLQTLSRSLDRSTELARLALELPRLEAADVERVRAQQIAEIAFAEKEPQTIAVDAWYGAAFAGTAYARSGRGTAASLAAITRADLDAHRKLLFTRDRLRVVVVGDTDAKQAAAVVDHIFSGLPATSQLPPVQKLIPRRHTAPTIVERDLSLATAVFGVPGMDSHDRDYSALVVLNHIMGSGDFDSRLMDAVRVKRGLTYAIKSRISNDAATSLLIGSFATKNEEMGRALEVVRAELSRMAADGPTEEETSNAKSYLTGSFLLGFDTSAKVADRLLTIWLDGHGPQYLAQRNAAIERVTSADVKRVARALLSPENMLLSIVGKPKLTP
jgi:zinc protease